MSQAKIEDGNFILAVDSPNAPHVFAAYASAVADTNPEDAQAYLAMAMRAVEVRRDEDGTFYHPACPIDASQELVADGDGDEDDDEGMGLDLSDWLREQGFLAATVRMSDDDDSSQLEVLYEDTGCFDQWEPAPPKGDGWFLFALYDDDLDGPVALYARRDVQ